MVFLDPGQGTLLYCFLGHRIVIFHAMFFCFTGKCLLSKSLLQVQSYENLAHGKFGCESRWNL